MHARQPRSRRDTSTAYPGRWNEATRRPRDPEELAGRGPCPRVRLHQKPALPPERGQGAEHAQGPIARVQGWRLDRGDLCRIPQPLYRLLHRDHHALHSLRAEYAAALTPASCVPAGGDDRSVKNRASRAACSALAPRRRNRQASREKGERPVRGPSPSPECGGPWSCRHRGNRSSWRPSTRRYRSLDAHNCVRNRTPPPQHRTVRSPELAPSS